MWSMLSCWVGDILAEFAWRVGSNCGGLESSYGEHDLEVLLLLV